MTDPVESWPVQAKARLLSGDDMWHLKDVPEASLPRVMVTDGPHGLRKQTEEGGLAGVAATCFPTAAGLAATWDVELIGEIGEALARECIAENVAVILGPGANIKRHPLCGRNFEYFSEDPYLTGVLAAAIISGTQRHGVGTSIKHYAANNQEANRMALDTIVDERTLREIYLAGFEYAVKHAQPWTVMCAYNLLNGTYCSDDEWLLTTVLRDEWGFAGVVMTDWGATHDRVQGVRAGLDLEMPGSAGANDALVVGAVADGSLDETALDVAASRMIQLIERSNKPDPSAPAADLEGHHELACRAAAASQVLLTNDGILPLATDRSIAVIGAFATEPRYQGAGSSVIRPTRIDTLLDAVRDTVDDPAAVTYAPGYSLTDDQPDSDLIAEAASLAAMADVAIVAAGLPPSYESEAFDRDHMRIPDSHDRLIRAVVAANPDTVVLLSNGSPVEMPWVAEPRAVVECYLAGQGSGTGAARVLFGEVNPAGKLAETFAHRQSDHGSDLSFGASVGKQVQYREGVFVGYRWFDSTDTDVLFPFGHGLSYTTFEYGEMTVDASLDADAADFGARVTIPITNTGDRAGVEVAQLYVRDVEASVARPDRELKAFDRVVLEPGETATATFTLDRRSFAFWSDDGWRVEQGEFDLLVGASSRDLRAEQRIVVQSTASTEDPACPPSFATLHDRASFEELLGHPIPPVAPVRPFTRDSTIAEVSQTRPGRGLRKLMIAQARKQVGGDEEINLDELIDKAIDGMPLRGVVLLSQGAVSWTALDRLIAVLNRLPARSRGRRR